MGKNESATEDKPDPMDKCHALVAINSSATYRAQYNKKPSKKVEILTVFFFRVEETRHSEKKKKNKKTFQPNTTAV